MPPLLNSGYTFSAFLERLERSALPYIAPLYHEHQLLFTKRPDMFDKAILAISWERGLELLRAAYYVQPIELQTYRALLARMLLHNQQVRLRHAGQYVDWRSALRVYEEAIIAHGLKVPSVMTRYILRLLAPHRRAQEAVALLQLAQANGKLTKLLLIEAARVCATREKWPEALSFLMHVHNQEPSLLYNTIQSLRPAHTTLLASEDTAMYSLLPSDLRRNKSFYSIAVDKQQSCQLRRGKEAEIDENDDDRNYGPSARQRHIIHILNDIVSVIPPSVSLTNPLCRSYLTHLIASTTLDANEKTELLLHALSPFSWQTTLHLLTTYTEPNLLSSREWAKMAESETARLPLPETNHHNYTQKHKRTRSKIVKGKRLPEQQKKKKKMVKFMPNAKSAIKKKAMNKGAKLETTTQFLTEELSSNRSDNDSNGVVNDSEANMENESSHTTTASNNEDNGNNNNDDGNSNYYSFSETVDESNKNNGDSNNKSINDTNYQEMFECLHSRLQWLRSAHAASMMAVMITKFPTPLMALEFVKSCSDYLKKENDLSESQFIHLGEKSTYDKQNDVVSGGSNSDKDYSREKNLEDVNNTHLTFIPHIHSKSSITKPYETDNEEEVNESAQLSSISESSHSFERALPYHSNISMINSSLITRHPAVIHALLQTCTSALPMTRATPHHSTSVTSYTDTASENDRCNIRNNDEQMENIMSDEDKEEMRWQVASRILLEWSGPHVPTATDILSNIIMQLRKAKQTTLMIRILNEHIVPSHSTLNKPALLAMMEAILAHNRAVHIVEMELREHYKLSSCNDNNNLSTATWNRSAALHLNNNKSNRSIEEWLHQQLPAEVHWKSALSWALDLQAEEVQRHQIVQSGTGPSAGAVSRRPATAVHIDKALWSELLNILLCICVEAGSAKAALRALGYARRVGKVELFLSNEIRALLYCILYNRPNEAIAIVMHAEKKLGRNVALPLRKLLLLAQQQKKLQRLRNTYVSKAPSIKHANDLAETDESLHNKQQQQRQL